MNERIRELAEQAGYKPLPGFDFANSLQEVFLKKFALLIVSECVEQLRECQEEMTEASKDPHDSVPTRLFNEGAAWAYEGAQIVLKRHFGVE